MFVDIKKPLATDNGELQRDGGGVAGRHCDCVSCEVFGVSVSCRHCFVEKNLIVEYVFRLVLVQRSIFIVQHL